MLFLKRRPRCPKLALFTPKERARSPAPGRYTTQAIYIPQGIGKDSAHRLQSQARQNLHDIRHETPTPIDRKPVAYHVQGQEITPLGAFQNIRTDNSFLVLVNFMVLLSIRVLRKRC